jgi:nicotinamide mononucleotide adenylyltransferase
MDVTEFQYLFPLKSQERIKTAIDIFFKDNIKNRKNYLLPVFKFLNEKLNFYHFITNKEINGICNFK